MPATTWRRGVQCDVSPSDGSAVLLDPTASRLVHLTGAAAALARGGDTPRRDDVLLHLRALGLVDATGEPAHRIATDRRRVLTAAAAAALGISVLVLPGAASAASVDPAWSTSAQDPLGLELARAVLSDPVTDPDVAYLAGGLGGDAVIARLDRDSGARGAAVPLLSDAPRVCYPVDMVRIGDRVHVLVLIVSDRLVDAFAPNANTYLGSAIVEVLLGSTGPDAVDGLEVLRSTDLADLLVAAPGFTFPGCLLTDGAKLYLGVALAYDAPEEGEALGAALLLEVDVTGTVLAVGSGVQILETAVEPGVFLPLSGVVQDGVAIVWMQWPDYLPETLGPEAYGVLARIDLDDPETGLALLGLGPILPIFVATAALMTLQQRPAPVVFAGSAYVATVVPPTLAGGDGADPGVVVGRFDLADPSLWGGVELGVPTEFLVLDIRSDALVLTLSLRGDTLVVSTLYEVIVVPLGPDGALPGIEAVRTLALDVEGGPFRDPSSGATDPERFGLAPMVPTTRVARAFFGTGKGKADLVEVSV